VSTNPDEISCSDTERRKSSVVKPEVSGESKPEIDHEEDETKHLQPQPIPVIHD
jgi:hypothetical protein